MVKLYRREGGEFRVNTSIKKNQAGATVLQLASGGFLISWSEPLQPEGYGSVFRLQIYDASGAPVGGERPVEGTLSATISGGFALTRTEGSTHRVQLYDALGNAQGPEAVVQTQPLEGFVSYQEVELLASGRIVVSWLHQSTYSPEWDVYAQLFEANGTAVAPAFQANSYRPGDADRQDLVLVQALASGGFLMLWQDTGARDDYQAMRGQIYDADGVTVGSNFRINTTVSGSQGSPSVASLEGGGFVVAWVDDISYLSEIRAQMFTDAGVKIGPEIQVNTISSGLQRSPQVAGLSDGGFVVTWTDNSLQTGDDSYFGIAAQIFDSGGARVGTQFLVNGTTDSYQDYPSVAALPSGKFVVAWNDRSGADGDPDGSVKAQIFAPASGGPGDLSLSSATVSETALGNFAAALISDDGGVNSAKRYELISDSTGGAFRIEGNRLVVGNNMLLDFETAPSATVTVRVTDDNGNSYDEAITLAISDSHVETRYTGGADIPVASIAGWPVEFAAATASLASGGFVMAWMTPAAAAVDGSGFAIRAQRYDEAGTPIGEALLVNTAARGDQAGPTVAGLAGGGFVVAWEDGSGHGDTSGIGIKAQVYGAAGEKIGGEVLVNAGTAGDQIDPAVTALASGGFVVTWTSWNFPAGVMAQLFDSSGAKVGSEFAVHDDLAGSRHSSSVAATAGGGFIVSWTDWGTGNIAAQRFDGAGNRLGGVLGVSTRNLNEEEASTVAVLASGAFVIAWQQPGDDPSFSSSHGIRAQLFSAGGEKLGGEFWVNTEASNIQKAPVAIALADGSFLISWQDGSGKGSDPHAIRAQMFDGSGNRLGGEFVVNAAAPVTQSSPVAAALSSGAFVVGWSEGDPSRMALEARVFAAAAQPSPGPDRLVGTASDDRIDGLSGDDSILGLAGDDTLQGGAGADRMDGGRGSDGHWVDDPGDVVVESAGQGVDWVYTTLASYTLPDHVENLDGRNNAHTLTGNGLNNAVVGTMRANVLNGEGGNDLLIGEFGGDVLNGGDGDDILLGGLVNAPDLIVNGSFETQDGSNASRDFILAAPGTDAVSHFRASAALHGWTSATGQPVELRTASADNAFNPGRGTAVLHMETAAGGNQSIYQDISGVAAGTRLLLNLAAALPAGGGSAAVEVYWNGALVGTVAPASTAMTLHAFIVTGGQSGTNRLELREVGAGADGRGTLIDSVELRTVMTYIDTVADVLNGGAGNDVILADGGNDTLDGGAGADRMSGGLGDDVYVVDDAGDVVIEAAGEGVDEVRTTLADYAIPDHVEKVTGTRAAGAAQTLRGNSGNNIVAGGASNDLFRLEQGGSDNASGGAGDDAFIFGAALDALDVVDGGEGGRDQLGIQGDYSGFTFGASNLGGIETLAILSGSDTRFGAPGTARHSYELTTLDSNVAAGKQLVVNMNGLLLGENVRFDGSAETDGNFFFYGGGGTDHLIGGAKADSFFFGDGLFSATDRVVGGADRDQLGLRGTHTIVFGADTMSGIETLALVSGSDTRFGSLRPDSRFDITTNDANVAAGEQLSVNANGLLSGETLVFNGSAETDGFFRILSGKGDDTLTGGAGNDIFYGNGGKDRLTGGGGNDLFLYRSADDSRPGSADEILDFRSGDRIDLSAIDADSTLAGNQPFAFIDGAAFSNRAGELRVTVNGSLWTLQADTDGDGHADFEITVTAADGHLPVAQDFSF